MHSNTYVIIVAGGKGTRLKSDIPKQFISIHDKPIIAYTIEKFIDLTHLKDIIVVCNKDYINLCNSIVAQYFQDKSIQIVEGGTTRFHSVLNGLEAISNYKEPDIVAVHDAVRPFISYKCIHSLIEETSKNQNAIPCIKVSNTIYKLDENHNPFALDREALRAVQTPQCFNLKQLNNAYQFALNKNKNNFTDDASVWQFANNNLNLCEGEEQNIKITYPQDLMLAKIMIAP